MNNVIRSILLFISMGIIALSCERNDITFNTNSKLVFTTDTVTFDTIFTSLGSTTKWFKVKNTNKQAVNISSISLAGKEKSPFRININGIESYNEPDILIAAGDSIYIFVEVTIDPTGINNPMVIHDSIVFNLNGIHSDVDLIAFGQDFNLIDGEILKTTTWENNKPYLVYNSVLIDSLETLTVDKGCRIHFFKGSSMLIKGTLHANGSLNEPIYFQGSRLEEPYKNIPGQWGAILPTPDGSGLFLGGIHFLKGSKENKLNHVIIKNANKGIQVDSVGSSTAPTLTISNSRVENMAVNCLDARTTTVLAYNTVFANSGANTVALKFGGEYEFYHCTIANYFNIKNRNEPALLLNNHFVYNKIIYPFDLKKATFGNCIIYGANEKEISLDNQYNSQAVPTDFNYTFDHCLIKITNTNQINPLNFINSIFNDDPKFSNIAEFNYSLNTLSAAIDVGKTDIANIYPLDINQVSRISDNGPDLGAIEWVE